MSYTKIESKFMQTINGVVTLYVHDKTKAKIMTLSNDDPNKVFSIAFRTPAINNAGITHILEHSVLCGSKKYPVKDPFVELLKGSLNTFLNAFTFPDKTMYPCASLNNKDFNNLMDVYLDAVFYPNIYKNPYIFKQEGWHYVLENKDDDIKINGVVYNEMKGAFSDPMSVLGRNVMHSLFSDNTYGFESGGDPKYIPDLSYEEFKEFHSKYYSPSNSYIFLYGNLDMDERLKYLDDNYLSKFEYVDFDTSIKPSKINELVVENHLYNVNEKSNNQDFLSYNIGLNDNSDTKKMIALTTILELQFTKPGAPIKEALIKAGLAEDIDIIFENGIKNPFLSVVAINSNKGNLDKFIDIINYGINEAKLNIEEINASLSYSEFKLREAKADGPKGLGYILKVMEYWLYDNDPFDALDLLKYYDSLKKEDISYFYNLIKELLVDNKHRSIVTMIPSETFLKEEEDALNERLKSYKASLSESEIENLISETIRLKEYQEEPDTKEAIDTLPKLTIEDLSVEPMWTDVTADVLGKYRTIYTNLFTNGIAYIDYLFDISDFDANTLQYAKVLSYIYSLVNTKKHTYSELNMLEQLHTGGFTTNVKALDTINSEHKTFFDLKISAVKEHLIPAVQIVSETINESIFDKNRVLELLKEIKSGIEQSISHSGHQVAAIRAASYSSLSYYYMDMVSGIGYLDFITKSISEYSKNGDEFIKKLYDVQDLIFNKKRYLVNFTSDDSLTKNCFETADILYDSLGNNTISLKQDFIPKNLCEAIHTPYDVNFMARYADMNMNVTGYLYVLRNAISLDYLWQNVRVLGGAYGSLIRFGDLGSILLASYRDPNTTRTLDIFEELPNFVKNLDPSDDEMLKYKIGAIGALDDTFHVSTQGISAFNAYISGLTYEYKKNIRYEIINCSKDDLVKYAEHIKKALKDKYITALVSTKGLNECENSFKVKRELFQK